MENKINIVELLKDCPKGMELYCPVFGQCKLNRIYDINNKTCIEIIADNNEKIYCDKYGYCFYSLIREVILFPSKENRDWSTFQQPFKDGDIISNGFGCICIYKSEGWLKDTIDYYCGILSFGDFKIKSEQRAGSYFGCIKCYHLASEEERQKLFSAIKDNGYKWNPENKTLEKLVKPRFKVGDRIKVNCNNFRYNIKELTDTHYTLEEVDYKFKYTEPISEDKNWELVPPTSSM